jgi:hypothetical protein
MEKTVTVDRHPNSSVVTFETGADVLRFCWGLVRAYERYGKLDGAQMIVVESGSDHHGFVRVVPRDEQKAKAKGAAAGNERS